MAKDFSSMEDSNRSTNPDIHSLSDPSRRIFVRGGLATAMTGLFAPVLPGCAAPAASPQGGPQIGFTGVPVSTADRVVVPEGYVATAMFMWGDPVGVPGRMPAFRPDAGNSGADQEVQMGMHHDGMHYFPLDGSRRGLLVMNHEYTDEGLLHTDGMKTWNAGKVRKSIAGHGVSVIEIEAKPDGWAIVRPSRYARRITAGSPMEIGGPAAGHAMMKTAADPTGTRVLGTLNNCAHGHTPWGTYLTGEENWAGYFNGPDKPDAHQARWGLRSDGNGYRWHEHEQRFDATRHPNEPNRFGWVVEIDP
ncbi:MAG TPA: alkaline phosphatase PhoX, partial [Albitalea sp.]|nr:alkaline phosphatase PhoX [Albitalea sp.]